MEILAATGSKPLAASPEKSARLGGDFDTFLKMLTVQMRNQDPLNPIDSTDYAVQLATFSGVEQQVQTNDLLSELVQSLRNDMSGLTGWIGAEVKVQGPVHFDGVPKTVFVQPPEGADGAQLLARDSQGRLVGRQPADAQSGAFSWLGASLEGGRLPSGIYDLEVEYSKAGAVIAQSQVAAFSPVAEIRLKESGSRLVLVGGAEIGTEQVQALRRPDRA